jgi:hypothetical protein
MSNKHSAEIALSVPLPAELERSEHRADTPDPDAELSSETIEDTLYNDGLAIDEEELTYAGTDGDRGISKP